MKVNISITLKVNEEIVNPQVAETKIHEFYQKVNELLITNLIEMGDGWGSELFMEEVDDDETL